MNEGIDDEHGRRAAELAAELRGKCFSLSNASFDVLYEACAGHTDGGIVQDTTVQTCWDSDNRIRRGTFRNVEQLIQAIMDYIQEHNQSPKPFVWTAKAEEILAKVQRARNVLDKLQSV